jgi:hypothetical protein
MERAKKRSATINAMTPAVDSAPKKRPVKAAAASEPTVDSAPEKSGVIRLQDLCGIIESDVPTDIARFKHDYLKMLKIPEDEIKA